MHEVMYDNEPPANDATVSRKNHLHAVLHGEYGPLPHPLRFLPLIGFLSLTASELTPSLLLGMQIRVYE